MHYLDTSALVKLVSAEAETDALLAWAHEHDSALATSRLARTELVRAVRRSHPGLLGRALEVLATLYLLEIPPSAFDAAAHLEPPGLRSLDAIHLATAMRLGDQLAGVVSYDARLNEAARRLGIRVVSPA